MAVRFAADSLYLLSVLAPSLLLSNCNPFRPAEVLYKRDALYNFLEEGFLSDDILQSVGSSSTLSSDSTLSDIRRRCLERARDMALDRMVSMMLHTNIGYHSRAGGTQNVKGEFRQDYPRVFSDREVILGSMDFADLLQQHFVAYQDLSSTDRCVVVIRIIQPDLSKKIRRHPLSFQPRP